MKRIRMVRTSMGRLGRFLQGKEYTVEDATAELLQAADACAIVELEDRGKTFPAEVMDAEPEAETAEARPKRRTRKRAPKKVSGED